MSYIADSNSGSKGDEIKPVGRILSMPVESSKNSNSSDIYASALYPNRLSELPLNFPQTPLQIFLQSVHKFPNQPFLGRTSFETPVQFKWLTYRDLYNRIVKFGSVLPKLSSKFGLPKGKNQLAILGRPEPEWILVDLACQAYSWKTLTLFENFSISVLKNLSQTINDCSVAVCDLKRVANLLSVSDNNWKNLRLIICMSQIDRFNKLHFNHLIGWAKEKGVTLVSLQELESKGELTSNPAFKPFKPFKPKQVSTVGFTQGTMDLPKGVQFTGYQLSFSTYSITMHLGGYYDQSSVEYSHLSYANLNARIGLYHLMSIGGRVGYYSHREEGLRRMQIDCKQLAPTHMRTTTETLEQIYRQIIEIVQSDKVIHKQYKKLLDYTLEYRLNFHESNPEFKTYLVSKLFSALTLKFQFWFGYRLKYIFCIGAPVSAKVQQLLELLMNVTIAQGYTTTETCGIVLCTQPSDSKGCYGTTGGVIPGYEVKLVDCPDLGYFVNGANNSRGELWVRGPSVGAQYFNTKSSTLNEDSFSNGWYKTGDIAEIAPYRGTFNIIDRKSNFFQLKDGNHVTPEKIEKEYLKSPLINQIYIPQNSTLTGIIVPNTNEFMPWLQYTINDQFDPNNIDEYLKDSQILDQFLSKINSSMKSMKVLKDFEMLDKILLVSNKFEDLEGVISPTFKLKRSSLFKHFSKLLSSENEDPESKL